MTEVGSPRTESVSACPLCGATSHRQRFEEPDRLFGVPGRYRYRECSDCQTVFQSPRVILGDLPLLYPGGYYTHETREPQTQSTDGRGAALRAVRDGLARRIRSAVRPGEGSPGLLGRLLASNRFLRERAFRDRGLDEVIPRGADSGRLLDVGCGAGTHMRFLGELGWEVEGLEWDPHAAEVARRVTGRPVTVGDVHSLDPTVAFDAIWMHHVFEHIADPVADLRRIKELLRPNGRAVVVWPNPRGLGARRFGPAWLHWDPPRHLAIPPVSAVVAAARSAGLRVASWRSLGRGAASISACSVALREGRPVALDNPDIRMPDKLFHWFERLLLLVDPEAGEEVVLVLER